MIAVNGFPGKPTLLDGNGRPISSRDHDAHPDARGIALPHGFQFIARQGGLNQYWHDRFDEALRYSRESARAMENDAWLMGLLQERLLSVVGLGWHLEVPDDKDEFQITVKDTLTRLIKYIPNWRRMLWWWLQAIWYGKSAVQVAWEWVDVRDEPAEPVKKKPDEQEAMLQQMERKDSTLRYLRKAIQGDPKDRLARLAYQDRVEELTNGQSRLRPSPNGIRHQQQREQHHERKGLTIKSAYPVQGDKIGHMLDHTPYILIDSSRQGDFPNADFVTTTIGGSGLLVTGSWCERFLFHYHLMEDVDFFVPDQAEAIHGVGVRSKIFWLNWLRLEWLANITDFFDRVGLGITLWRYPMGNAQALTAVQQAARDQSNRAHIFVPVPPEGTADNAGVQRIEVPTSGSDALMKMVEYVDKQIERYIVGQEGSASATSASGHSNKSSSDFQRATKEKITIHDAVMLADSLSGTPDAPALVNTMLRYTFPEADFPVRMVFDVDSQESQERLQAIETLNRLKVPVRADDARKAAGVGKPADGDEIIEPPQEQGAGGPGGAEGGGNPLEALLGGAGGAEGQPGQEQPPAAPGDGEQGDFLASLQADQEQQATSATPSANGQPQGDFIDSLRHARLIRTLRYLRQQGKTDLAEALIRAAARRAAREGRTS